MTDPDCNGHPNPYVFVVGCPRSGTTLAQRTLETPILPWPTTRDFITRAAKRELRRQADPVLDAGLVERVASYHRFHRMGLHRDDVMAAASGASTYSVFVSRLYDIRAERAGKTLSGEKTPDYCRTMPVLHRLFPFARFIHVVRDGRDTALSALRWAAKGKGPGRWGLWQEDPLGSCALWWRWQVDLASSVVISSLCMRLRYTRSSAWICPPLSPERFPYNCGIRASANKTLI